MIGNANVNAVLAVKDLGQARQFYEGTLGLEVAKESPFNVVYKSGDTGLEVYVSEFAGTNQATAASWAVESVEDAAEALQAAGVVFEEYDMEGATREGAVHTMGGDKAAWFKDPDGNILCLHKDA
jgi:catechol 2,3-dioxygenase-like lactoylglutathione lyase family enzyme